MNVYWCPLKGVAHHFSPHRFRDITASKQWTEYGVSPHRYNHILIALDVYAGIRYRRYQKRTETVSFPKRRSVNWPCQLLKVRLRNFFGLSLIQSVITILVLPNLSNGGWLLVVITLFQLSAAIRQNMELFKHKIPSKTNVPSSTAPMPLTKI